MDFAALYKSKLTTPEEAVKVVKSGDWVDYGWCTGTPNALDKALAARMDELENVNFRGGVLMRGGDFRCAGCCRQADLELLAYVRYRTKTDRPRMCLLFSDPLLRTASLLP